VKIVIRYYPRDIGFASKQLTPQESQSFASAERRLDTVHEARHGDRIESLSRNLGMQDGAYADEYATQVIGPPVNSAKGINVAFQAVNGLSNYTHKPAAEAKRRTARGLF
jgi:hypothetical protein